MTSTTLPPSPIASLATVEITSRFEQALQDFFEANPLYFTTVTGEPARADEAHEEIHDALPAGWPHTKKWLIGYVDAQQRVVAVANIVSDLLATNVWHIGLLLVATERHGSGDAQAIYRGLESWAAANGARWLRLGVVVGNARAERFWQRQGYAEVRTREGVVMGERTNTLRVMVKSLAGDPIERYFALVERDRPA